MLAVKEKDRLRCKVCNSLYVCNHINELPLIFCTSKQQYLILCVSCYTSLLLKYLKKKCLLCGAAEQLVEMCTVHKIGDRVAGIRICPKCLDELSKTERAL